MSWLTPFSEINACLFPLAPLTTWKVGGRAKTFLQPRHAAEAAAVFAALHDADQAFRILGGGANVLIDDGDHGVPYLHLNHLATKQVDENGILVVGAGFPFLKLVNETVRQGLSGLEGLAGIPGQMGGICRMNAGGKWGEIKDVVAFVDIARPDGRMERLEPEACGFSYRHSQIPGLILAVGLALKESAAPKETKEKLVSYLKAKGASQPLQMPSAGCCFANPEGHSTGRLVEELGLKGRRSGNAQISEQHGNFIVNLGGATFQDVLSLIELIESTVKSHHGLTLRREVEIWPRA